MHTTLKTLILKIGSSTLTEGTSHISRGKIEDIARQFKVLQQQYRIVLVSSGAIAAARQFAEPDLLLSVSGKQALAAIGQLQLMRIYQEIFRDYELKTAQCLLTYYDFRKEENRQNTLNTLTTLLDHGYIPIINENDTVSTHEIQFGDNDKLAALTAELLDANLLVLATDINGLYEDDPKSNPEAPIIQTVQDIQKVRRYIADSKSQLGSGGMQSKIDAAQIAQTAQIECWILNGRTPKFLLMGLEGKTEFTRVLPIGACR